MKLKLVKIVFIKNLLTKMKKLVFLLYIFFLIFEPTLCVVLFDYFEIVAIVKMRAVIEKEKALNMREIVSFMITNKLVMYSTVAVLFSPSVLHLNLGISFSKCTGFTGKITITNHKVNQ